MAPRDALPSIQKVIQLRRQLAADHPAAFNPGLALSFCEDPDFLAVPRVYFLDRKMVFQLQKQLAADGPVAVWLENLDYRIAYSLYNCSLNLRFDKDSLDERQFVKLERQLEADGSDAFDPRLVDDVLNMSS